MLRDGAPLDGAVWRSSRVLHRLDTFRCFEQLWKLLLLLRPSSRGRYSALQAQIWALRTTFLLRTLSLGALKTHILLYGISRQIPQTRPSLDEFNLLSQNNVVASAAPNHRSPFFLSAGEYIFSLRDLKYNLFAHVVKERFGNLYWEDDLLGVLHCLVNYSSAPL